jgi:hypothetical protein
MRAGCIHPANPSTAYVDRKRFTAVGVPEALGFTYQNGTSLPAASSISLNRQGSDLTALVVAVIE